MTIEQVFDFDKFAAINKQKTFIFRCKDCKRVFKEKSADKTLETECHHCGEWNYSDKTE